MTVPSETQSLQGFPDRNPGVRIKICGLMTPEDVAIMNRLRPDYVGFVFAKTRHEISEETAASLRRILDPEIPAVGVFVDETPERIAALVGAGTIQMVQLHGREDAAYIAKLRELIMETVQDRRWRRERFSGEDGLTREIPHEGSSCKEGPIAVAVPSRDMCPHLRTQGHDGIKDSCGSSAQAACESIEDAARGALECARRCAPGATVSSMTEQLPIAQEPVDCRGWDVPPIVRAVRVRDGSEVALAEAQDCDYLLFDTWDKDVPGGSGRRFDLSHLPSRINRPWFLAGGLTSDNITEVLQEVTSGQAAPFAVDVSSGVESRVAGGHKDEARTERFIQAVRCFRSRSSPKAL